ncbi:hypothetical protein [Sphingobium sp.]|uniref:hypothetical protein n=1 Tax=Sphingobium sp. TaxID=1912891 RepID=UPI003BB64706
MRLSHPRLSVLSILLLTGACVAPSQRPPAASHAPRPTHRPAPAPAPVQPATPAPTATEWQYRPVAPGIWTYRADDTATIARFGPTAADTRLSLRCDRATRRVTLSRAGSGQGPIVLRTSFGATSWPATSSPTPTPHVMAIRAASDTVLDQIAYSRGKFAVEAPGLDALIVPAWPEVARVVEDCRA